MAKNHYSTKPKRRNKSGKRQDTQRAANTMAKLRQLEKAEYDRGMTNILDYIRGVAESIHPSIK